MPGYEYGPDVDFRQQLIDGGPAFAEVLVDRVCPSCGADWNRPGSVRIGFQIGREVLCWACMRYHRQRRSRSR